MQEQLQALQEAVRRVDRGPPECQSLGTPFSDEIERETYPAGFRMPYVELYRGSTDPREHLETYRALMRVQGVPPAILCQAFPLTLAGVAKRWFYSLPGGSIRGFEELARSFLDHFRGAQVRKKPISSLLGLKQGKDETLRDFVNRYQAEVSLVDRYDDGIALSGLLGGIRPDQPVAWSLSKGAPGSYPALLDKVSKYADAEDMFRARYPGYSPTMSTMVRGPRDQGERVVGVRANRLQGREPRGKEPLDDRRKEKPREAPYSRVMPPAFVPPPMPVHQVSRPQKESVPQPKFNNYTLLNTPRELILARSRDKQLFRAPPPMRQGPGRRNKKRYCHFHKDHGHDTAECLALKDEIEELVRRGHLAEFVLHRKEGPSGGHDTQLDRGEAPTDEQTYTIYGGPQAGNSRNARKKRAREARSSTREVCVNVCTKLDPHCPVTFTERDAQGILHPHCDALVISAIIANQSARKILVDDGSSADIMSLQTFDGLGLNRGDLRCLQTALSGFGGEGGDASCLKAR